MKFRYFFTVFLCASSLVMAADPAWKQELTSSSPGPFPALKPCVVDLRISWKGMLEAGKIRMEVAPKDSPKAGALVVRSSAASVGLGASLFPYSSNFWSEQDPVSHKPRYFHSVEVDKKEHVDSTNCYFADRVESSETTKSFKKGTKETKNRVFRYSPVFDIFSAMTHVRSQNLNAGDKIVLVVCPFDSPYILRMKVIGREVHDGKKTIRLSAGMQKIDRKTMALVPYKKMKGDATLWLSDDDNRVPVEFRAAVFIGDVRATLVNFQKK